MNDDLPILPPGFGPGSHGEEERPDCPSMPRAMRTFERPALPEPGQLSGHPIALALLERLQEALGAYRIGEQSRVIGLDRQPKADLKLLQQILGEGEVAIQVGGQRPARIQETVLAGVWWVQLQIGRGEVVGQWLEVADVPALVRRRAFAETRWPQLGELPDGLLNAGPVLVELLDAAKRHAERALATPHAVNLSLLPFSPEDRRFLAERLGEGSVTLLSRGYGNCRIASTATPGIWCVQYFNSSDRLILDTLEVTGIPQVACAAQEDIDDSAERLREIREALE
ncbi:hydrogenase expression/formation protein HoxQ [Azotobacter vinelandii CA]|uniref:Hydrogenase expression/formation protein HoxQ n=2 Tax=Azotobacter vinelandii TaxID=354 RepID=C1DLE8_AZOVD|nr:hydrogenase expression/formation protein [Azotobacter vinelandii]AAA22129.1 hoxQ [Azotobacter vinelandii]ACO81141.1 hydrogenase expression/formation protein HoxQ [Azotobacter vinelandii DJ]AGK13594.1 hydrogenase expression/formation protein HoxQ [Azotobacter vinelandii CA]SFX92575.1 hydrogenase-1 operon protein HyaF [Azotobacter vinelandii]GLK61051.1 hydrogenase expression/formation protein [Azotobacter vinelandii]